MSPVTGLFPRPTPLPWSISPKSLNVKYSLELVNLEVHIILFLSAHCSLLSLCLVALQTAVTAMVPGLEAAPVSAADREGEGATAGKVGSESSRGPA